MARVQIAINSSGCHSGCLAFPCQNLDLQILHIRHRVMMQHCIEYFKYALRSACILLLMGLQAQTFTISITISGQTQNQDSFWLVLILTALKKI